MEILTYGILNEDCEIIYINYWISGYDYFDDEYFINEDASMKAIVENNKELLEWTGYDCNYVILDRTEDYYKGIERTKELIKILLNKDIKDYDINEWMNIKMRKELEWEEEDKINMELSESIDFKQN